MISLHCALGGELWCTLQYSTYLLRRVLQCWDLVLQAIQSFTGKVIDSYDWTQKSNTVTLEKTHFNSFMDDILKLAGKKYRRFRHIRNIFNFHGETIAFSYEVVVHLGLGTGFVFWLYRAKRSAH